MLKGLSPLLTADLLHALRAMGHGDELAIVDANFPAASVGRRLIEVPGAGSPEVLAAVLAVLPVDTFESPAVVTMEVVGDAAAVPPRFAISRRCLRRRGLVRSLSVTSIAARSTRVHGTPSPSCVPESCVPAATSWSSRAWSMRHLELGRGSSL